MIQLGLDSKLTLDKGDLLIMDSKVWGNFSMIEIQEAYVVNGSLRYTYCWLICGGEPNDDIRTNVSLAAFFGWYKVC